MALIIYLKQPERVIAAKGDKDQLAGAIKEDYNRHEVVTFETIKGDTILVNLASVSYIEAITDKELKKRQEDHRKRQNQEKQKQGQIIRPNFLIPKNRTQ